MSPAAEGRPTALVPAWILALVSTLALAACGDDGSPRGDVELHLLFEVDSLDRPESVAWDGERSRYLVTIIEGEGDARDGNGFVTAVSGDGSQVAFRALDSSTPGLRLDGPKGIAVRGDRAYIADIQRLVAVDLTADTGLFSRDIPESDLLNDVALGPADTVYVSDTRGDAVFAVAPDGSSHHRIAVAGSLRGPNGLAPIPGTGDLLVAGWEGVVLRLGERGAVSLVAEPRRAEHLDGIQRDPRGGILVTDFTRGTLERIPPQDPGGTRVVPTLWLEDLPGPADFLLRDSILALPELNGDRLRVYRVHRPGQREGS